MVTSRGAAKLSLLMEGKILFGKFDKGCGWEGRGRVSNGHKFGWTLGVGDGQRGLEC